jgi:uncharacterized protein YihD (DUF1040 family)
MENSADILNELKELSPFIARLEKINVFTVPAGYFENLSADILLGISSERGGIINTPLSFVSADVPRGYFENLSDQIMDKIKAQNTADELKSLSPMLYSIQNENVFEVPTGYFDGLAGTVVSKIKPQQTKVVVMKRRSTTFIKYAVAAAFTGVMALGVFKFTNSNKNNVDAVVALGDKIARENRFDEELEKVTDADIVKFLEANGSDVKAALVASSVDENELPSQEDYLMDEKALDKYLNSINVKELKN